MNKYSTQKTGYIVGFFVVLAIILLLLISNYQRGDNPPENVQVNSSSSTVTLSSNSVEEEDTVIPVQTITPTENVVTNAAIATNEAVALPETATKSATSKSSIPTPTPIPAADTPTPTPTLTPEPSTNTPALVSSPTSPLVSETPDSGEAKYSAEKISLEPVSLSFDLPGISAQGVEPPQINFGGWSNSGQQFTFAILFPDGMTEQWIVNIDGTGLQKITSPGLCGLRSWSPDDSQLLCYKYKGDDFQKDEIWIAQLDTNEWVKLDEPPGIKIGDTDVYNSDQVAWLDNQRLLYPTYSKTGGRHLWIHNVLNGQIEEVVVDKILNDKWRSLKFAPDRISMIGSISVEGRAEGLWLGQLVQVDNRWKVNYIKTVISDEVVIPTWSPDSSKLAIKFFDQSSNIVHIIDVTSDRIIEIPFPLEVSWIGWSPDNQMMIVTTRSPGNSPTTPIYVVNTDGSNLRLLLEDFPVGFVQWSPDGQYLIFNIPNDKEFDIFRVEVK